jgi:hypothetical protein
MNSLLRRTSWIFLGLPILPALLIGGMFAEEAARIAFASPEAIAGYHFGSETMVGHGGWAYRSHQTYVFSLAIWAAPLIGFSGLLTWILARRRDSTPWLVAGAAAFLLALAAATAATSAAWLHNPQSEFHSASSVNWGGLFVVASGWFAPVYAGALLVARPVAGLVTGARHAV